jgi:nicotinamide-nucleotide amidase
MDETSWLAEQAGQALSARRMLLVTAESCTGGGVAQAVTEIAGSSAWFERGFITYSNQAKSDMLAVPMRLIDLHGAVSEEVAQAMALGALGASKAQVALSVTGIAGPGGATPGKPVGLVCFGWADLSGAHTECVHFPGDRSAVRQQSVRHALQGLLSFIERD